MANIILLSLILSYTFTNSDEYPVKEATDNHMYMISSEIKNLKYFNENNVEVPVYLDENYLKKAYDETNNQKQNEEDNSLVEKNIKKYINIYDFGRLLYDSHIKHLDAPDIKDIEITENLNNLKNSSYHQSKKGVSNQKVSYKASSPKDIHDPPHLNFKNNKAHSLGDEDFRVTLFVPNNIAKYRYLSNNRFNTYSNSLNSVFHTQVNVDSPGSSFNIANEFPLLNDISAESSNNDEISERIKDELKNKSSGEALSIDVKCTSDTAETDVELLSDLHGDGYHYNKPSIIFFY